MSRWAAAAAAAAAYLLVTVTVGVGATCTGTADLYTDRAGGDYESFLLDTPVYALCQSACCNDTACASRAIAAPGFINPDNVPRCGWRGGLRPGVEFIPVLPGV